MRSIAHVSSLVRSGFFLAVAATGLQSATPAFGAPDDGLEGVTVTAPGRFARDPATGAPIDLITLSRRVSYHGLDLQTPEGSRELDRRIKEAANWACRRLEALYPVGRPEPTTCAKTAIAEAQPQVIEAKAILPQR